jgi:hypothetical protein
MREGLKRYVFFAAPALASEPQKKHKSGKPGFRRNAPETRPKQEG